MNNIENIQFIELNISALKLAIQNRAIIWINKYGSILAEKFEKRFLKIKDTIIHCDQGQMNTKQTEDLNMLYKLYKLLINKV